MRQLFMACALLVSVTAFSQVGIGTSTPNAKAALEISSTEKGFLIPRMDSLSRVAITNPPDGLMVFQTDQRKGFWYVVGGAWLYIPDKTSSGDNLGNHTATQAVNLQNQLLVGANAVNGTPGTTGIRINGAGQVGIGTSSPGQLLQLGSITRQQPAFLRVAAGNGYAQREYNLGMTLNPSNLSDVAGENYDFIIQDATDNITRLQIDYGTGNVGIGKDPTAKLDVAGGVKADSVVSDRVVATAVVAGTVSSPSFTYPTAKNRVLSIPCDAFVSTRPSVYQAEMSLSGQGINVTNTLKLDGGTSGATGLVSAPVYLPDGAVIKQLQFIGYERSPAQINCTATLSAVTLNSSPQTAFHLATSTLPASNPNAIFQTASSPVASHVVNNNAYSYKVVVSLNASSNSTQLAGVKILYTVGTAD